MSTRWSVVTDRRVEKQLKRLPVGVRTILDQLRHDFEEEGPMPKGWITKHVLGRKGVYAARLKRDYRVLFVLDGLQIRLISVAHRKEVY